MYNVRERDKDERREKIDDDSLDKPQVNLRHGSNQVTNLNVLVIENDRLTIDCHVQSNPLNKEPLTWLKNGASLPGKST